MCKKTISALLVATIVLTGCGSAVTKVPSEPPADTDFAEGVRTFKAEVWADNWFAMYINGELVQEDSVPITTERSFNAESFTFEAEYPFQVGIVARDFIENDTGLEYIGSGRQQMGDGGIIVQITDVESGKIVAATNSAWKSLVIHRAPLDEACVDLQNPVAGEGPCACEIEPKPDGWSTINFDDSAWEPAVEHSENAVRPKDGYNEIGWATWARLVWSSDLEKDNTVLLRKTVGPEAD